ncbi:MAG: peptide transporter [Armatimonadota bacterium]|nr:peptide transporter [Armatimonadota bacterium]
MAEMDSISAARLDAEEAAKDERQEVAFEDGFSMKSVIGAIFVGFVMVPGAMYLGLVAGQGLGPAAQWVTIVLFAEIARRSFLPLKKQEIFILYYVAGGLGTGVLASIGVAGGPFGNLIFWQYFVQSPQAAHIAKEVPTWYVPAKGSAALTHRTFMHAAWTTPIILLVINEVLGRLNGLGLGYALFRITSDVERLPFPMAPVAASGATALAEAGSKEESWRWQLFSIGNMIGLVFGVVYVFIPIFTGLILSKPLMLIPIPFVDLMANTEHVLPSALTGITGNIGAVMIGFVLPFWSVVGMFASSVVCQIGLNPILYHHGFFPTWSPGMSTIPSQIATSIDFWMSIGIGTGLAVGVIGLMSVARTLMVTRGTNRSFAASIPRGRGDYPIAVAIGMWLFATAAYIIICKRLVPGFPILLTMFYGLIWTPLNSYVSARMFGLTGQGVSFPLFQQATIMKSGYTQADIWFAPLPLGDLGMMSQFFREVELTGTKITSIIKAEIMMFFIILVTSFVFWSFFWKTSPIPAPQFPYAQKFWPMEATMRGIWLTANKTGADNFILKALKCWLIDHRSVPLVEIGAGIGFGSYFVLAITRAPMLLFYGLMGGIGSLPHVTIPMFAGAMLGRYYFARRFGAMKWTMYAPVLLAGFSCGMGLTAMSGVALALIAKSVSYLPF